MTDNQPGRTRGTRYWQLLLKILVTGVCLWYVSGKIDFNRAGQALATARWTWLLPALLLFILSKLVSALRLNLYFSDIGIQLPPGQNTRLYWLGMFYNLFLPGSISGDAYKVILLTKKFGTSYKKTTGAVILDRLSGLLGLALIMAVYGFLVISQLVFAAGIAVAALVSVVLLYYIVRRFFHDFVPSFSSTLFLGILVQAIQVACIYCIMGSLGIPLSESLYIFIFLVSSVVAVLPLTIGGLGIREVVFLEASRRLGLVEETAVLISLFFYLITVITSLWGIGYVFRNPLKK